MKNLTFFKTFALFAGIFFVAASSGWGQENIVIDFSDEDAWEGGAMGGYNDKTYEEDGWLFSADDAVRETTEARRIGDYSWRLRESVWIAENTIEGTYTGFEIKVRPWNANTEPSSAGYYILSVSTDGGENWTVVDDEIGVLALEWHIYSHSFGEEGIEFEEGEFQVKLDGTANEHRLNVGEFTAVVPLGEDPVLLVSPPNLENLDYLEGEGPSDPQSFTLSGTNLDESNVTITASANFEISETEGGTYGSTITLTAFDGTETDIWVQLTDDLDVDSYSGDITIEGGGADEVTVAVAGSVSLDYDYTEGFDNYPETGTGYESGDFEGIAGNTWYYVDGRGTPTIDGRTVVLRNNTEASLNSSIAGGITEFRFDYMQAFGTNVHLEVHINGSLAATVTTDDEQNIVKNSGNISVADAQGTFTIEFKQGTSPTGGQVAIDNFSWKQAEIEDPYISANPTTLSGFTYLEGEGPSEEQQFIVSGENLEDDITINAPDNYEISETSGSGYTDEIVLTQTDGEVLETDIFVILKSGLAVGTYEENIEITSEDADMRDIALEGEVTEPFIAEVPFYTNFDDIDNWVGGTSGYTGGAEYHESGWSFIGVETLRGSGGYDGSGYFFQNRGDFTITNEGSINGMTGFSLYIRDWMDDEDTDRDIVLSIDGGNTSEVVGTINKAWFDNDDDYFAFIHYFEQAQDIDENDLIVLFEGSNNNAYRVRIGGFEALDEDPPEVDDAENFDALAQYDAGEHIIDLSWDLNAANNDVLLAWSSDGIFGSEPDTHVPGETIDGGGIVLYSGDDTSFAHEGLDPNTTYYYKLWSFATGTYSMGITTDATTFPDPETTTLPYVEDFATDLGETFVFTTAGSKPWSHNSDGWAEVNGWGGEPTEHHWMILPGINFDDHSDIEMTFDSWWQFGNDDEDNYLKLRYSTDYPGVGDPGVAIWDEIVFDKLGSSSTWESSGIVDLSFIESTSVWLAFEYYSTDSPRKWQIDNIYVYDPTAITEPDNHVTNFTATTNSHEAITVAWKDSDADGYLIKGSDGDFGDILDPVDGTPEAVNLLVKNVGSGVQSYQFASLDPETTYYFKIFPYNGSGTTINYKTDETVPEVSSTTDPAPTVIFSENMGTGIANSIDDYDGWENDPPVAFTGTADVRTTQSSSGYPGASGNSNVFFTSTVDRFFLIEGVDVRGYENLSLSFGQHKAQTDANNELKVEVSGDGDDWAELNYARDDGAVWALINPEGEILGNIDNLRIRFTQTSDDYQFRVDDLQLTGTQITDATYNTIAINGTSEGWQAGEIFPNVTGADNAHFTWDEDYLYFAISGEEADFGNMATFMYFDTTPESFDGTTDTYTWGENIVTSFLTNYVVVWKNEVGADYIEIRQWNGSDWVQIGDATSSSYNDGEIEFAIGADYREVRIKRSILGDPDKITVASITEQQWGSNWRYFGWPSQGWTDEGRTPGQTMTHGYTYELTEFVYPNEAKYLQENLIVDDDETIAENVTVDNVYIAPGKNLTITTGHDLTVSGNVFIFSDETGTGSLIHNTPGVQATAERYIEQTSGWGEGHVAVDWHMIASPVAEQAIEGDWIDGDYDFFAWGEATGEWLNQKVETNNIDDFIPGQGYLVAYRETDTKEFSGELNTGNVTINLSHSDPAGKHDWYGWNLLGNPYPSAIDWGQVNHDVYFEDDYAYVWNRGKDGGPGYEQIDGDGEDAYIAANQGFFVLAIPDQDAEFFTFNNDIRVHGPEFMKNNDTNPERLVVRLGNETYYDETTIRIEAGTDFKRDRRDALKLMSFADYVPQVYTYTEDNVDVAINSIPQIDEEQPITLGMRIPADGEYTLALQEISGAFVASTLLLEDTQKGIIRDLHENPEYVFEAEEGDHSGRFVLHFDKTDDDPTGIDEVEEPAIQTWYNNSTLFVNSHHDSAEVLVFDISGRQMYRFLAGPGDHQYRVNLPAGVYVVHTTTQNSSQSMRIVVSQ